MQINKISMATSFGNLPKNRNCKREDRNNYPSEKISERAERILTPQEIYIDKRLKEQEANFKKAMEKQNALIGSSLVALVNYLNNNSDANTTKNIIQEKLIKPSKEKKNIRVEI